MHCLTGVAKPFDSLHAGQPTLDMVHLEVRCRPTNSVVALMRVASNAIFLVAHEMGVRRGGRCEIKAAKGTVEEQWRNSERAEEGPQGMNSKRQ